MIRIVAKRLWPLVALLLLANCTGEPGFPEDQRIEGPFQITTEWQTIHFDRPLVINREGFQGLHFAVDSNLYDANSNYDLEDMPNQANLHRTDGVVVKPEVVLIGDNGEEVRVQARSNIFLYAGGMTVGFGPHIDNFTPPPHYPESIHAFRAVRVRGNHPFVANHLQWLMDSHPDHHRCGGRRCTWWEKFVR